MIYLYFIRERMKKKRTLFFCFVLFFFFSKWNFFQLFFIFYCFECCVKWSPSFRSCAVLCLYSFEDRILLERGNYRIILYDDDDYWNGKREERWVAPLDKWQEPRYYQSVSIRRDQDPLSLSLSLLVLLGRRLSCQGIVENTLNIK